MQPESREKKGTLIWRKSIFYIFPWLVVFFNPKSPGVTAERPFIIPDPKKCHQWRSLVPFKSDCVPLLPFFLLIYQHSICSVLRRLTKYIVSIQSAEESQFPDSLASLLLLATSSREGKAEKGGSFQKLGNKLVAQASPAEQLQLTM